MTLIDSRTKLRIGALECSRPWDQIIVPTKQRQSANTSVKSFDFIVLKEISARSRRDDAQTQKLSASPVEKRNQRHEIRKSGELFPNLTRTGLCDIFIDK